jgi:uracil-DNA glycosylase
MSVKNQLDLFTDIEPDSPGVIDLNKPTIYDSLNLKELYSKVSNCNKCILKESSKNIVFGRGSINSPPLIFIGEGPGKEEDKCGEPFVGKSGQLLSRILSSVEINEEECYLTNIVLCRPTENRAPFKEEVDMCLPRLIRQINIIKPKALVLVGGEAYKAFFNTKKITISDVRGKWFNTTVYYMKDKLKIFCVFHPSYLLRNMSTEKDSPRWLTWQDFKILKEFTT